MKNKQNQERDAPCASQEKKIEAASLAKLESYAVQGLELGQKIFQKLDDVEHFVEMLLRQKAQELKPKKPGVKKAP